MQKSPSAPTAPPPLFIKPQGVLQSLRTQVPFLRGAASGRHKCSREISGGAELFKEMYRLLPTLSFEDGNLRPVLPLWSASCCYPLRICKDCVFLCGYGPFAVGIPSGSVCSFVAPRFCLQVSLEDSKRATCVYGTQNSNYCHRVPCK